MSVRDLGLVSNSFPFLFHSRDPEALSLSLMPRFPKLCCASSGDVLSSHQQAPKPLDKPSSSDSGEPKIHPDPPNQAPSDARIDALFAAVSAVKSAYISLQQAHLPYRPNMVRVADALVVSELDALSHLQSLHTTDSQSQLEEYRELVEELKVRIDSSEPEIYSLRLQIDQLNHQNAEMSLLLTLRQETTVHMFSELVGLVNDSIHEFAKMLIQLMKVTGWNLDRAADAAAGGGVAYFNRSHKKYAFEAFLSRVMLDGDQWFELSEYDRVMSFCDPFDALVDEPDSGFARFCRSKYIAAMHSKMESSFFGNLDQRSFVMSGGHPRTPFYQAFVRMARWVWALGVMAGSFIPKAGMFCAGKGQVYCKEYMENVVNVHGRRGDEARLKVGMTVMPGFKIGRDVIRCRVYLCKMECS